MRYPADDAHSGRRRRAAGPEATPFVVFAMDAEGIFTTFKGEGLAALSLKSGEDVGRSAFDVYRDEPAVAKNLDHALWGDSFFSVVQIGEATFHRRCEPLRDAEGKVVGTLGLAVEAGAS